MSSRPRTIRINGVRHTVRFTSSDPSVSSNSSIIADNNNNNSGEKTSKAETTEQALEKAQIKKEEKLRHSIFDEFDKISKRLREMK